MQNEDDKKEFENIEHDLYSIKENSPIKTSDINDFISKMKNISVKRYLEHIRAGAKIETALRESFFAGQSILLILFMLKNHINIYT